MKFIGRKKEIKEINYLINLDGYKSAIIYGRRRLGKTELIKYCIKNSNVEYIYYQCNQDNEENNIADLHTLIKDKFDCKNIIFPSFIDIIEYIFKQSLNKKIILVIDEYPYIRKLVNGLDSKLQRVIDMYQNECNLKFFLLGSSISTMEDIQSDKNPLYRRFNLSILLKEMNYLESSEFYSSYSNEDKVRLYAAFGGVPFYNKQIDCNLSVKENIIKLLSGNFAYINEDITTYLKEELSKLMNAYQVFSSIAMGAYHYSDILSKTSFNTSATLYDTLETLTKMDLIGYNAPINDKKNKKKAGYVISDSCVYFYYKYIYHNLSAKQILDEETFYELYISKKFEEERVPKIFEKIVKEYLIIKNKKGLNKYLYTDIGTYWYDDPVTKKNGEFDVVCKTDSGYVFYEVKFRNQKIDDELIENEIIQVNNSKLNAIDFGFVSKSGFDLKKSYSYEFITLDDLYNISD